jgi:uncharacterized protein YjbI with pentapeptide repeats
LYCWFEGLMESTLQSKLHGTTRSYFKMKRTLTALTVAASLIASGASAADYADLQKLATNSCMSCDLTYANLYRSDLMGANLTRADLRGATLLFADLRSANLSGANLRSANLTGAYLSGAELNGADLSRANLTGADLRGADLSGADLLGAILCNTIMPDGSVIYSGC